MTNLNILIKRKSIHPEIIKREKNKVRVGRKKNDFKIIKFLIT